jgi:dihydroorotate dehydrogenase
MTSLYRRLVFPLLSRLPAEQAHDLTISVLSTAGTTAVGRFLLRRIAGPIPRRPVPVCGLSFPNVLGLAAGFDKDARAVEALALLGFGHIEVGTVTPYPQSGNPKPRVFRLPSDEALINRMGFPSQGVAQVVSRLRRLPGERSFVLGVSLGKQKVTALSDAVDDYVVTLGAVYAYADYVAVNISSPNTPGLRELQGRKYIAQFLARLNEARTALEDGQQMPRRPLLVKIAPDLRPEELDDMLQVILEEGVDGIIATNTTTSREGVHHPAGREAGGISGAPLRDMNTALIADIYQGVGERLPIVAVGGVSSAADVREKLDAGASLVQVYTGFVYEGPAMPGRILRAL